MDEQAREIKIPALLLVAAVLVYAVFGFAYAGTLGAAVVVTLVVVHLVVGVALAILACFLAAALMDISFGPLGTAVLKLAAVFAFPAAVSLLIPFVGWLVALILFVSLLAFLFELEAREVTVTAVLVWLASVVAGLLARSVAGG